MTNRSCCCNLEGSSAENRGITVNVFGSFGQLNLKLENINLHFSLYLCCVLSILAASCHVIKAATFCVEYPMKNIALLHCSKPIGVLSL